MQTITQDNLAIQFSRALHGLNVSSPGPTEFDDLRQRMASVLELSTREVAIASIAGAPAVTSVLSDRLPNGKCRLLLAIVQHGSELTNCAKAIAQFIGQGRNLDCAAMCTLSSYNDWYIPIIICRSSDGLGARIKDLLSPSAQVVQPATASPGAARGPGSAAAGPIVMDERIMRMARLALASSSAVILVGPPGTGKTTIIKQLLQEVARNPAAFGLRNIPREPKWVTPSENWTLADLVGGQGIDEKGRRRFRMGHVLEAIHEDRWLVLDEANRANMDRIFGGLLTWLSDQRVELGKACTDMNSPSVMLDWNDAPPCKTARLELLDADKIVTSDPILFQAGLEWRLMGTYNVQDSHKVFSFGQALGRRFVRVPIPVIEPEQFRHALAPLAKELPEEVRKAVLCLYAAHRQSKGAQLGPAIFLKIASYLTAGLKLPQLANISVVRNKARPADAGDDLLMQLVAEAYVSSAGMYLGGLSPEDLAGLTKAVLAGGFPEEQWRWVLALAPSLG
ncbi:MAG: AAA family ATPase [Phycisphaerae bacterium]